jgi:P27 family predicted phage terminase small subunit
MPGTAFSGRRRVPNALRVANGARPDLLREEIQLPFAIPEPPEHLSDDERRNWFKFAKDIKRMRTSAAVDWAAFETLVTVFTEVQRLTEDVRRNGYTFTFARQDGSEYERARPQTQLLNLARTQLRPLLALFGLSPADRSRVKDLAPDGKPGDTADGEFGGVQ